MYRLKIKPMTAIAACAFAIATATGQPLPSVPPPPRAQTPPGVLEGQSPPRPDPSQQGRPLPQRRDLESGPLVPLATRNSAAMPVWVTLSRDGLLDQAGCLMPKEDRIWRLPPDADRTAWKVGAEVSGKKNECAQPIACTASIDRRPGMSALELRAGQKDCGWAVAGVRAASEPPVLKGYGYASTYNATDRTIWVTVYRVDVTRYAIASGCVYPGKFETWGFLQSVTHYVQAELTRSPNCQQPVDCTTTMQYHPSYGNVQLLANSKNCWWERKPGG